MAMIRTIPATLPTMIPMIVPVLKPSSVVVAGGTPPSVLSIFPLVPGSVFPSGGTVVLVVEDVFPALVDVVDCGRSPVVSGVVPIVVVGGLLVVYWVVMKVKFIPRISGGKLNLMESGRHSPLETAEGSLESHGGQAHINCVPL